MQRRNVLFPEPDGPMMHSTSLGATSRLIPRSTCSRPKLLWTASARTMAVLLMSSMLGCNPRCGSMEGDEHTPEALPWRGRKIASGAAREIALQVVLANGQHRREHEVPDADHNQQ